MEVSESSIVFNNVCDLCTSKQSAFRQWYKLLLFVFAAIRVDGDAVWDTGRHRAGYDAKSIMTTLVSGGCSKGRKQVVVEFGGWFAFFGVDSQGRLTLRKALMESIVKDAFP